MLRHMDKIYSYHNAECFVSASDKLLHGAITSSSQMVHQVETVAGLANMQLLGSMHHCTDFCWTRYA